MAKVVYNGGIASFKGSIGSLTFQQNRSGSIVRKRPSVYKSITSKQSRIINDFNNYQRLYQNLSQSNIDLWTTFATAYARTDMWGISKALSGINWFCSINYYRVLTSNSVLDSPPAYASPISIPAFTVLVKKNSIVISWLNSWGASTDNLLIYTSSPILSKVPANRSALRLTKIVNTGPFHSYDIKIDWETTHDLDYPPGQINPDFYINIAIRTAKNSSCIMGAASFIVSKYENTDIGIGSMIVGSTFKIN